MLALALLLLAGSAPTVDREAVTSARLNGLVADGEPGLAVLVRRNGHTILERGYGYTKEPTGFRETDQSPTSATLGDGGVYSCVEDLAKWDEALRTNALLSGAEIAPALTLVRLADGSEPRWPEGEQGGATSLPAARSRTASAGSSNHGRDARAPGTTGRRRASGRSWSASPRTARPSSSWRTAAIST